MPEGSACAKRGQASGPAVLLRHDDEGNPFDVSLIFLHKVVFMTTYKIFLDGKMMAERSTDFSNNERKSFRERYHAEADGAIYANRKSFPKLIVGEKVENIVEYHFKRKQPAQPAA